MAQPSHRLTRAALAAALPRRLAHGNRKLSPPEGLRLHEIGHIADLVARFAPESTKS